MSSFQINDCSYHLARFYVLCLNVQNNPLLFNFGQLEIIRCFVSCESIIMFCYPRHQFIYPFSRANEGFVILKLLPSYAYSSILWRKEVRAFTSNQTFSVISLPL